MEGPMRVVSSGAVGQPKTDDLARCPACGQLLDYRSTDPLTGLLDRRSWDERATEALQRGGVNSLLIADVDRFKRINDTLGHQAGDTVLQVIAAVIAGAVRESDIVGRYGGHGGDEFLVFLPGAERSRGMAVAQRIQAQVRAETIVVRSVHGPLVPVSQIAVSIGVVTWCCTQEEDDLRSLVRRADAALLASKRACRDGIGSAADAVISSGKAASIDSTRGEKRLCR
ncbi:GGDEF domain-containing protein [Amycolatopsis sp. NPDC059021]|uniref:GGDEF domain-containing protein n=1 Tax=Amycolatopsis sp. NPDC059021 TaxID=3346704 RepID=UPI00366FAC6B